MFVTVVPTLPFTGPAVANAMVCGCGAGCCPPSPPPPPPQALTSSASDIIPAYDPRRLMVRVLPLRRPPFIVCAPAVVPRLFRNVDHVFIDPCASVERCTNPRDENFYRCPVRQSAGRDSHARSC